MYLFLFQGQRISLFSPVPELTMQSWLALNSLSSVPTSQVLVLHAQAAIKIYRLKTTNKFRAMTITDVTLCVVGEGMLFWRAMLGKKHISSSHCLQSQHELQMACRFRCDRQANELSCQVRQHRLRGLQIFEGEGLLWRTLKEFSYEEKEQYTGSW